LLSTRHASCMLQLMLFDMCDFGKPKVHDV